MTQIGEQENIKSVLNKAGGYFQTNNYRGVINILTPLLDILHKPVYRDQLITTLYYLGIGYCEVGPLTKARTYLEEGLNLARTGENQSLIHRFLHELSLVAFQEKRLSDSMSLSSEALSIGLAADDDVGNTIMHVAVLFQMSRKFNEAKEVLQTVRANCERNLDIQLLSRILNELGLVEFEIGNYQMGVKSFIESISLKQILGDSRGMQKTVTNLKGCFMRFPNAMKDPEVKRIIDRIS